MAFSAVELLERAAALAESKRNLTIMDGAAALHGYLELTRLDPNNGAYRQDVEAAVASLQQLVYDSVTPTT